MALILAMGSLGVGYAMWSDTVTINGSVDTGTLKLGISKAWYGEPWGECEWYDEGGVGHNCKDVGSVNAYRAGDILCSVLYGGVSTAAFERAEFIINNAYPCYRPSIWIDVANCGTIPIHITDIGITAAQVDGEGNIIEQLNLFWVTPIPPQTRSAELRDSEGNVIITMDFVNLVCSQIHPGGYDNVEVDFHFPSNEMPQNAFYKIVITVYGEQWAE
jgi:predicted ribosomally synthesized peptide with SipW-like signal peptide